MSDPFKPSKSLLVKLGSIAVHTDEMMSARGHAFDRNALDTVLHDLEVAEWLDDMSALGLLPVKR